MKTIIFDLGGVIVDLNFERMSQRFEALGVTDFSELFNLNAQKGVFIELELGKISPEEFYQAFRELTGITATDEEIRDAWNSILEPFVVERMALLEKLAESHELYLFSNTNAIHAENFEADCISQTGKPLSSYFKKVFYSHELHERKPDVSAFQQVMKETGDAVFIDDNADNIAGANSAGLKTIHLTKDKTILDLDYH